MPNDAPRQPADPTVDPDRRDGDVLPDADRRRLLLKGGKLLAYAAPLVLLTRPRPAFASGETGITP